MKDKNMEDTVVDSKKLESLINRVEKRLDKMLRADKIPVKALVDFLNEELI